MYVKVRVDKNFIQNHIFSVHITDVATVMIGCFITIDEQKNTEIIGFVNRKDNDGWITI